MSMLVENFEHQEELSKFSKNGQIFDNVNKLIKIFEKFANFCENL